MWIDKNEAAKLSGKSVRTIERWISQNVDKVTHVDNRGFVNTDELGKVYVIDTMSTNRLEAMELANEQSQIQQNADFLSHQKDIIEKLINKKSRLPIWLTVGFVVLILTIVAAFSLYTNQMSSIHEKDLVQQSTASTIKFEAQQQQIEGLKDLIKAKDNIEAIQSDQIKNLTEEVVELKQQILNSKKMPRYNVSGSSIALP